ncbi:MAG: helix-turn-helix domain-containing protein [Eubacterium sp.]
MANAKKIDKYKQIDRFNNPFPKRFRKLMGEMTQEKLSKELGVSRQTVSNYYNGKSEPDYNMLVKIARYFNVSTDYLTGKTDVKADDITLQQVCEYSGLSETAINKLTNKSLYRGDEYRFINQIIEHENFIDLLDLITAHIWNKDINHYKATDIDVNSLAKLFGCTTDLLKKHLEMSSQNVIEETFMKIVNDITYYEK